MDKKMIDAWFGVVYILAGVFVLSSMGCASMFLHGGKLVKNDIVKDAVASYRVDHCETVPASAEKIEKPAADIHLILEKGQEYLFERGSDGEGTLIQNKWKTEEATHYYCWVKGMGIAVGVEYVFPDGNRQAARRLAYADVSYKKFPEGSRRPISAPIIECKLSPQKLAAR